MKKFIFLFCVFILAVGAPSLALATARFSPGETLNPSCSPTDPDCTVSTPRLPDTFVVSDLAARDAIPNVAVGDVAIVTSLNETYQFTQGNVWQKFSKSILANVYLVSNIAARDALPNLQAGDVVVVTDVNESFVRTQTATWQIFSKTLLANNYVVPDLTALNALPDLQAGDTAVVTSISKSFVRTQAGLWQELLSPPSIVTIKHTYVVTDLATRDALPNLEAGDVAIVTNSNTTYIYTQDNTWQQLLVPATNAVLSVNSKTGSVTLNSDDISEGILNKYYTDSRARGAVSVSSPLSYNALTGAFGFSFSSPLVLNGSSLGIDPTLLNLSDLGGVLSVAKGGTGATSASAAIAGLLPSMSGNSGKFLTTDGSVVSWGTVAGAATTTWGSIAGTLTNQTDLTTALSNKLTSALASGAILVGNASNLATAVTLSGDATISNTGALALVGSGVVAGSYGIPYVTIDAKGRITSATQRTITGTVNRLSVTNGNGTAGDPTVDISASYVGQSSITTLGTITVGTWNGTTIAMANGGTSNGSLAATAGGVLYTDGSKVVNSGAGTANQVLMSNGSSAPTWTNGGTMMFAGDSSNASVNNTTLFFPMTDGVAGNATDSQAGTRTLISRAGTIKNLRVLLSAVLAAGKTGSVTVMKNGVATTLLTTLDTINTSFSDVSHSFTVAAGDEIGIKVTETGNVKFSWAADFTY